MATRQAIQRALENAWDQGAKYRRWANREPSRSDDNVDEYLGKAAECERDVEVAQKKLAAMDEAGIDWVPGAEFSRVDPKVAVRQAREALAQWREHRNNTSSRRATSTEDRYDVDGC